MSYILLITEDPLITVLTHPSVFFIVYICALLFDKHIISSSLTLAPSNLRILLLPGAVYDRNSKMVPPRMLVLLPLPYIPDKSLTVPLLLST